MYTPTAFRTVFHHWNEDCLETEYAIIDQIIDYKLSLIRMRIFRSRKFLSTDLSLVESKFYKIFAVYLFTLFALINNKTHHCQQLSTFM